MCSSQQPVECGTGHARRTLPCQSVDLVSLSALRAAGRAVFPMLPVSQNSMLLNSLQGIKVYGGKA